MRLLIISHKRCWVDRASPSGHATDGGFGLQVGALAGLFDQTTLRVPVSRHPAPAGLTPLPGGIVVQALPAAEGPLWRRRLTALSWFPTLLRAVRRADAVHAPVPGDVGFLGVLAASATRTPLFVRHCATWQEPRTRADRSLRWILDRLAGGRTVVLATGAGEGPPSPDRPDVHWIFSSSITQADLDEVRGRWQDRVPEPGRARLVTGGRLIVDKGADTVLRAFADLRARGLADHLDVVGDGPARSQLEAQATDLGIADAVTFHGRLPRTGVLDVFDGADLFVYPTRSSEGFPKLVLEAMARGLPSVATAVSAIPAMLEGCGVITDADASSVAAAAADLLADPARYRALRDQTLSSAARYTLEAWVAEIEHRLEPAWGPLRHRAPAEQP